MKQDEAKSIVSEFWRHLNGKNWEEAREMLSEEFEAYWPQSREKIVGPDNFIELNRRYPGEHKIQIQNSHCEYDNWDHEYTVITQVSIESKMPDGKEMKLYGISFFELDWEGLIKGANEYWADTYNPPDWRKDLVERY